MSVMDVMIAPRTGFRLQNPVIAASGTFGYGVEFERKMDITGLGALICKGTTRQARTGNAPLRMVETAAGMLNSIGLQNVGVEAVVLDKAPIWARWMVPVLVNVSATSVEEYVEIVKLLDGVPGVAGIELNISCPNVECGGALFSTDPGLTKDVTVAVRMATQLPLVVKLSPNVTDIRSIAAAAEDGGADAVSLINTLYGMSIDTRRRAPALAHISGGLSGPAIKPHALYLVYQVSQEVSVPVIGIGGIMTHLDAIEFLLAGATAIELATALLIDPTAWRGMVAGIAEWCRRENVTSLDQIIGAANVGFKGGKVRPGGLSLTGS